MDLNKKYTLQQILTEDCGCFKKMKEGGEVPYTEGELKVGSFPFDERKNLIQTINGKTIAVCQHDTKGIVSEEEAEANAERIVKAVNMHDELVKILGRIVRQAQTPNTFDPGKISHTVLLQARKLVNQAETK